MQGSGAAEAGVLTAGAWDDNLNFDHFLAYRDSVGAGASRALPSFSTDEHRVALDRFGGVREGNDQLDLALIIDTTGSMSDEIRYLQAEFQQIAEDIDIAFPDAAQRWSLILYRDIGDEYVVRSFDFVSDREEFQRQLAAQSANGGGDYPEAPDAALAALQDLSWRAGDQVARMAFWVADAPHHAENSSRLADQVRAAATRDIHLYPVASSGVDETTEFTMRASAQLTGGRYLFLTDDSGVGGSHKEPTIPCYFVTRLQQALTRMVAIEMTGEYREPATEEVLRTGGDPTDGACELEDGATVLIF